ncbi:MAG: ATP-dependent helicase [Campylobacteraceae bacterium]|nr:ATP-dependent helicase [Campylobacteraceae bacterium]
MNMTKQQEDILSSINNYKSIKINAFAGTGKTSTLRLIANEHKEKKILYLAFNSAIKNEAQGLFPNNTSISTTHGLAYSAIKNNTNINLSELVNYRAIDISKRFKITYTKAITTLKIFEAFCNSSKLEISKDDLEHKTAQFMFDSMCDGSMKPTHSFYLKYYFLLLTQNKIQQFKYDVVMLDEAQDTNDVTLGIFEALDVDTKIYVGDQHQQIYSFRGSKNALNKIQCDKELYLSCSFRFNSDIASYANILLSNFKNETVAIDTLDSQDNDIQTHGFISRTNATLIATIAKRIDDRKPFVTIREPNEIFNLTSEVYYALNNQRDDIKRNRFLKDFSDEEEMAEYAKEVDDYELKTAIKVVKEHKEKIFEFKDIAQKFYNAWKNKKNNGFENRIKEILFLTTAHTAKGLEWDEVIIADDFTDFADIIADLECDNLKQYQEQKEFLTNQELIDEFNLFYVSITRAKKKLIKDSENFHYLMATDIEKLLNQRIKDTQQDVKSMARNKKVKISKLEKEDKQAARQVKNTEAGKAKNSGLKWTLDDRIKVKSMFKKNMSIGQIARKLERTAGAILGELFKSEVINKDNQIKLSQMLKEDPSNANKQSIL